MNAQAVAFLIGWLATTLIILAVAAIEERRVRRMDARLKNLVRHIHAAVSLHTWAKSRVGPNGNDWAAFDRELEYLGKLATDISEKQAS